MSNNKNKNSGGKLRKELGLFSGVSLVAGMTIGSGIYYLGSYVLERTNMSMGMALVCWLVGGLISIMGGLCFAELGAEMPVTGGLTTYLAKAYHPHAGLHQRLCRLFAHLLGLHCGPRHRCGHPVC